MFALGVLQHACANPNQPPGGPPDAAAPRIVKITPGSGNIGVSPKVVSFQFDEVISEVPKGAQDLAKLVFISPKSGDASVSWRRSQIDIKPKNGWKPNTVYTVLLNAGVMDLRNNSIDTATRVVFSTGGPIPETKIEGVAFDWQAGLYAPRAIVEAISKDIPVDTSKGAKPDSLIYQTVADSLGRYSLEHVPPGNYTIRAFIELTANRQLDPSERWDTTSVTVTQLANADLYAFQHDTLGVRIASITVMDSNRVLRVALNKPVSPTQTFQSAEFRVRRAEKNDSGLVVITTIFSAPQRALFDSLKAKTTADSIARMRPPLDTSADARAARDSVARVKARDSLAAVELQKLEDQRLLKLRGGKPLLTADTTPKPKMKRPPLYTDVYITLAQPLEFDGRYTLEVRNVRSVSGYAKPSPLQPFRAPPKPKPPDEKKP